MMRRRPPGLTQRVLVRLALHRPELRAWALYDWANSAMVTTVVASVFPIYYYKVAGAGLPPGVATQRFALCTTIALATTAVLAPFLGIVADFTAAKKKFLAAFLVLGAGAVAAMFCIDAGEWRLASVLYVLANVGAAGSAVFYDSLLPHVARDDELHRLSTSAYALGYLGGGLLLGLQAAWIAHPGWLGLPSGPDLPARAQTLPVRLALASVAGWWLVFSLPLFRRVPEPRVADPRPWNGATLAAAARHFAHTLRHLRSYRHAFLFMAAFLLYNDGLQTIIKMASIYGAEIGIGSQALLVAILLVQFVGIPCTLLFARVAERWGVKPTLAVTLAAYAGIAVFAFFMRTAAHFFALAIAVGCVQGGCQALSRSTFATLIPARHSSEFFGFFAVAEKFAGILGPACFAVAIQFTGSSRTAILSVLVFFVAGAVLLRGVDLKAGRADAQRAGGEDSSAATAL